MNNFFEQLTYIHDVECPVCGRHPSFDITGVHSYTTSYPCGHKELAQLIEEREEEIILNNSSGFVKPFK